MTAKTRIRLWRKKLKQGFLSLFAGYLHRRRARNKMHEPPLRISNPNAAGGMKQVEPKERHSRVG